MPEVAEAHAPAAEPQVETAKAAEEKAAAAPAQPEKTGEQKFVFPSLEKGPTCLYETERHEVWVGIPLEQINNPVVLMAALDRAKLDSLNYLFGFIAEIQRREMLKATPGLARVNAGLKSLFEKGKAAAKSAVSLRI